MGQSYARQRVSTSVVAELRFQSCDALSAGSPVRSGSGPSEIERSGKPDPSFADRPTSESDLGRPRGSGFRRRSISDGRARIVAAGDAARTGRPMVGVPARGRAVIRNRTLRATTPVFA